MYLRTCHDQWVGRKGLSIAVVAVVAVVTGCRAGTVDHVVDGDTVDVDGIRVRMIGYDTPERGQCGFNEAKARVAELVADQRVVVLDVAGVDKTDRYDRELAYIRRNEIDVSRVLISEGLAHARYDGLDGYDTHPLQDEYRALDAATPNLCE